MEDEEYDIEDDDDDYFDDEDDLDVPGRREAEVEIRQKYSLEEDRKRARKALLSATDRTMATYVVANGKNLRVYVDAPCHAGLTAIITSDLHLLASCFESRDTEKATRKVSIIPWCENGKLIIPFEGVAERYWNWTTGPSSPWKTLFQVAPPEAIRDDNEKLIGFFLEPQLASTYPAHVLNFCIAMRMIGEERETIKMWDRLVQNGMHEADALYLSRMVCEVDDSELVQYTGNSNNSSHWPLSFQRYDQNYVNHKYFSFDRFRNGNPKFEGNGLEEVRYWCDQKKYPDFSFAGIPAVMGNKRTYNERFKLEDVISAFYAWQEKHGQREKEERIAA